MNNEGRKLALKVFEEMARNNIVSLQVTVYWYDDEDHVLDEITIEDAHGEANMWGTADIPSLNDLAWLLDGSGVFELNARDFTISRVADAYMPEPELKFDHYLKPVLVERIDPSAPELPVVEFHDDTFAWSDPLHDLWGQFRQQPTEVRFNRAVLKYDWLTWNAGVPVQSVLSWFNSRHPDRFKVTFNV